MPSSQPKQPTLGRYRLWVCGLLFFCSLQLQGCKAVVFLGGILLSYTVEKGLDKLTEKLFGEKTNEAAVEIDKAKGTFLIREQLLVDAKTKKTFLFYNLTGEIKGGRLHYDQGSLQLIKERLGTEMCSDGKCRVLSVSQ